MLEYIQFISLLCACKKRVCSSSYICQEHATLKYTQFISELAKSALGSTF